MDIRKRLGVAIKDRRTRKEWTQETLGSLCCLHRTYVSDIERGKRNPSLESLDKIATALGCSLSDLFLAMELEQVPTT